MTPAYLRSPGEWNDTAFCLQLGLVGAIVLILWLCVIAAWGTQ